MSDPAEIKDFEDLSFDERNPNTHTERGMRLLRKSLKKLGAGRGIVVSRDGVILAGNATAEIAAKLGMKLKVVKTDGRELVIVQRVDLNRDDPRSREMRVADNRVGEVNLSWDQDAMRELRALAVESGLFSQLEFDAILGEGTFAITPEAAAAAAKMVADAESADVVKSEARTFSERRKETKALQSDRIDPEFVVEIVFPDAARRAAFLERWGLVDAPFLSGDSVRAALQERLA